jgi:hypothetical protein
MPLSPLRTLRIPSEYALRFDGIDDYVNIPHSDSLNSPAVINRITIEAWYYPTTFTYSYGAIYSKGGHYYVAWLVFSGGTTNIYLSLGYTPDDSWTIPNFLNQWHFLAITYDGSYIRWFYNGVKVRETAKTITIASSTDNALIGLNRLGYPEYLAGFIAKVCIYSRALSADEILWNYNYPYNPIRNGLILWLPGTDEAIQPPTWYDKSNFGNNGTIYGALKTQLIRKQVRTLAATRVLASAR